MQVNVRNNTINIVHRYVFLNIIKHSFKNYLLFYKKLMIFSLASPLLDFNHSPFNFFMSPPPHKNNIINNYRNFWAVVNASK